jgi:hypothetical protein
MNAKEKERGKLSTIKVVSVSLKSIPKIIKFISYAMMLKNSPNLSHLTVSLYLNHSKVSSMNKVLSLL